MAAAAPPTTTSEVQNALLRLAFMLATIDDTLAQPVLSSAVENARLAPTTLAQLRGDVLTLVAGVKKATTSFSLAIRPEGGVSASGPLDGLSASSLAAAEAQIKQVATDQMPKLVFVAQKARADGLAGVGAGRRWAQNVVAAVSRVSSALGGLVEAAMDTRCRTVLEATSAKREGRAPRPVAPAPSGTEGRDLVLRATGAVWAACDQAQQIPNDAIGALSAVLKGQQMMLQDALEELREGVQEAEEDGHDHSGEEEEEHAAEAGTDRVGASGAEADQDELDALMAGNDGLGERLPLAKRAVSLLEQCDAFLTLYGKALKVASTLDGAAVDEAAAALDEMAAKVDDSIDGILRGKDVLPGLSTDEMVAQLGGMTVSGASLGLGSEGRPSHPADPAAGPDEEDSDHEEEDDRLMLESIHTDLTGVCSSVTSAAQALAGTKGALRMEKEAAALSSALQAMADEGLFRPAEA